MQPSFQVSSMMMPMINNRRGRLIGNRLLGLITALTLLGASFALLYLFRVQRVVNSDLGVMTVKYRWGQPREILADSNRDGEVDYRELTSGPFGPISTHTSVAIEFWEDSDFDGQFECHAILESGMIKTLEIDSDGDGKYDKELSQREAREFYESRSKAARPK